jgi:hypothetical protein
MSTNSILTNDEVTTISLAALENMVEFLPRITRGYDKYFEGTPRIGSNINIRVPSFFYNDNSGPGFTTQSITQTQVVLVANQQPKVGIGLTDQELSMEVNDMVDLYIEPAAAELASTVDNILLGMLTGYTYGSTTGIIRPGLAGEYGGFYNVTTPGGLSGGAPVAWTGVDFNSAATSPASAAAPFNLARRLLIDESAPGRNFHCVLPTGAMAYTTSQMISLFNDREIVSEAFRSGLVKEYAGADFVESALVPTFTSGGWATSGVTVATTSVSGDTTLNLAGVGDSITINQGDQFTVAGCYATNRLTGAAYSWLRVFTVTQTVTSTSTGTVTVSVAPAIILSGASVAGPTVSNLPTAGNVVTFVGTPNRSTQVGCFFWEGAAAAAFPKLPSKLAGAIVGIANDEKNKISLRWTQQYQASAGEEYSRLETLFGGAVLRQGLGIRLMA